MTDRLFVVTLDNFRGRWTGFSPSPRIQKRENQNANRLWARRGLLKRSLEFTDPHPPKPRVCREFPVLASLGPKCFSTCTDADGVQKKKLDPLELELWAVVSSLMCVLGTKVALCNSCKHSEPSLHPYKTLKIYFILNYVFMLGVGCMCECR